MAFMTPEQVASMGFARVGENVLLSSKASFYNCKNIEIGSNVRIDDFCVISAGQGGVSIGSNIHIAVYSSLIGAGLIILGDYCNISSRVSIYSSTDDFSGAWMTSPVIPAIYTNVHSSEVKIGRHCIIGSGSVILPGSRLEDGCAIGSLSLVNGLCESFFIYAGIPCKIIKRRSKDLLSLEKKFLES